MRLKLNTSTYWKFSVAILVVALGMTVGYQAYAALTINATTITSDGALTMNGAAASAVTIGSAATTGGITIGAATHTGTTTISSGATTTDALDIGADTVTTGNGVDLSLAALTTGKGLDMSDMDAVTTGKAIHVDATGVTQTSGILVHLDSASTGITGAGRILLSDHTGATGTSAILNEFKSAATDETNIVKITASGALAAGVALDVDVDAMTTGTAIDLGEADALTTGILLNLESGATAMTGAGRLLYVNQTGATSTSGILAQIASITTDETEHLVITNTGAGPDANTTLIRGTYTADGDAQGRFLLFEDNAGDDMFLIAANGATTITGTAEGTAALTITGGDIVVTDGDLTLTAGDATFGEDVTVTGELGHRDSTEATAGDNTLTAAESGKTLYMGTAGEDQTLPAPADGVWYRFVVSANVATTNMTITGPAADATDDVIYGSVTVAGVVTLCSAEDTLTFVADTNEAIPGDWVELHSDGTNWYVSGQVSTASAFTCTDAD